MPALLPVSALTATEGVYYAVECAQTGLWTDPASGVCAKASEPASLDCAYGSGDACRACPTGGLCPGGFRLWTRVGYWVASEADSDVSPCAPPNPEVKCAGWDTTAGAVKCGAGYRPGSYLCGACANGFYSFGDGTWCVQGVIRRPNATNNPRFRLSTAPPAPSSSALGRATAPSSSCSRELLRRRSPLPFSSRCLCGSAAGHSLAALLCSWA